MFYTFEINISNCRKQITMLDAFKMLINNYNFLKLFYNQTTPNLISFSLHVYIELPCICVCGIPLLQWSWSLLKEMWVLQICVISTVSPISSSGVPWVLPPCRYPTERFRLLLVETWDSCAVWSELRWGGYRGTMTSTNPVQLLLLPLRGLFLFTINKHCVFVCLLFSVLLF